MHKLLILFLILVALFFMFMKKSEANSTDYAMGTGPGYIPAFQGHPQIGVRT
jgi:Na+/proline symporter